MTDGPIMQEPAIDVQPGEWFTCPVGELIGPERTPGLTSVTIGDQTVRIPEGVKSCVIHWQDGEPILVIA